MTSPESTRAAPKSPAVQDSPVSSYLSTLSPLKPVNTRPSLHLYGDASCPTPELVFTSPHLSRQPSLLKRSLLSGAEKFSSGYDDRAAAFSETGVVTPLSSQMVKFVPCIMNTCDIDGPSQDHPCGSPSTCVDAFLADPSENCDNPSGSPDPHLKQAAELTQGMQGEHISADENQTKCHKEDLVQAQRRTSSVLVTGSVADTLNHSTSSALLDLNSSQPIDLPQGFCNDSNSIGETYTEPQVPHVKTCINTEAAVNSCSLYQAEEDPAGEEKFLIVDLGENEGSVKIDERSLDVQLRPVFENVSANADSSKAPTSGAQLEQSPLDQDVTEYPSSLSKASDVNQGKENPSNTSLYSHGTKDSKVHCADSGQLCESDCAPHLQPGPLQNIQAGDIHLDDSGEISNISVDENYISYDQEEGAQYQRAMRKRLQFEAVENCRTSSGYQTNSRIVASDVSNLESRMTSMEMETVNASNKESIPTSSNKQLIQSVSGNALCSLSHEVGSRGRNKESLPVMVPRPLGIGLHLNSIGSAGPVNISASMQLPGKDVGVEGEKLLSGGTDQVLQYPNNFLTSMSLIGHHSAELCASSDNFSPYSAMVNSEGGDQGNHAIKVPNYCASYQSSLDVRPLRSTPQLKEIDRYMTPCSMKRPHPEDASRTVSTEKSPRRKRQMKKTPEKEGCKRCNCKRSKCLKLYCDCFAARVFCSETCSCQGCYNRLEHEDTIRETRQQIESRNPLAFAPKVVVRVTNSAKDTAILQEMERQTPTSARHKRGCNCKKSLCLKKYCECFQAGVGCSLGCRCDGCKNTFGRKDGCDEITETVHKKYVEIGLERDPSVGKLGGMEVKRGSVNTEHCYSRLSPLTPLFHASNGTGVPGPQLRAKYYPSPESRASVSPSYEESPSSPIDSISGDPFAKETGGASSLVPFRQDLGCQVDPFSPGWDGFPDICNLSPLPNPSPHDSGTSAGSKARAPRVLHAKLFPGSGRLSVGSLRWRSSPVTPLPHLGESKFVMEPDSDSGLLNNNHEDDTPEILKDTSSPIKAVTASSPNQKRVSPPHQHLQEIRSSSSPGLRSGRKFILQSVPSFPPLTPYSNNTSREHGT